jgi:hypothetical protein
MRQFVERQIATAFIESAIAAGHDISVHNGEEVVLWNSKDPEAIMGAMMTTDDDHLYVDARRDEHGRLNGLLGEVVLIYGNGGYDVIADYHTSLEPFMASADRLADYWDGSGAWVDPPADVDPLCTAEVQKVHEKWDADWAVHKARQAVAERLATDPEDERRDVVADPRRQ